jgi:hypothetical protein
MLRFAAESRARYRPPGRACCDSTDSVMVACWLEEL